MMKIIFFCCIVAFLLPQFALSQNTTMRGPCIPSPTWFHGKIVSVLPCNQVQPNLPVRLQWNGTDIGGVPDKNRKGTGFTMVLPDPHGVTGLVYYNPNLIDNSATGLKLTTWKGFFTNPIPDQINCLGVGMKFTDVFQNQVVIVETGLINLPQGTGSGEQAGLFFGLTQMEWVTLAMQSTFRGPVVQAQYGLNGIPQQTIDIMTPAITSTVKLGLIISPWNATVSCFIGDRSNIVAHFTNFFDSWFNANLANIDPVTRTQSWSCVFASHKNRNPNLSPLVYTFSDFNYYLALA